jgi:hypothetical protein
MGSATFASSLVSSTGATTSPSGLASSLFGASTAVTGMSIVTGSTGAGAGWTVPAAGTSAIFWGSTADMVGNFEGKDLWGVSDKECLLLQIFENGRLYAGSGSKRIRRLDRVVRRAERRMSEEEE